MSKEETTEQTRKMALQLLISSVGQDVHELVEKMQVASDAILVNQKTAYRAEEFEYKGCRIKAFSMDEQGVGLSRNHALMRADREYCLFADEDIVYDKGYVEKIEQEFARHPKADMLLFNVRVGEERRTYWTHRFHRVRWYNCGRYPAYSFAARTERLHEKNLVFHLWFGGGARYSNGEDSLFIRDALRKGLKIYAVPVEIGEEVPRPSTWFHGYNDQFFYDRGVLYHHLYGKFAPVMGFRFLLRCRRAVGEEYPLKEAAKQMRAGYRRKEAWAAQEK